MDRKRYPADWHDVSRVVRARAGGRCECAGECGRSHVGEIHPETGEAGEGARCPQCNGLEHTRTGSRVVLTVAHLWRGPCADHHATRVKCGERSHLKAMCQACHLAYDLPHHVANARATRRARRASGDLFGDPDA